MELSQSTGKSQHQLDPLEFVEPFLRHFIKQSLVSTSETRRARCAQLRCSHVSILCQSAVAGSSANVTVFAEKEVCDARVQGESEKQVRGKYFDEILVFALQYPFDFPISANASYISVAPKIHRKQREI